MPNTEDRISQREMEMLNQQDPRYANVASSVRNKRPMELVLESIKERLNRIEDELFDMAQRNIKTTRQLYGATSMFEEPVRRSVGDELAYRIDDTRREALQMERDKLVMAYAILSTNENIA